nr:MAG TPA: hypothetical protein [Caudoviricetes sp.]
MNNWQVVIVLPNATLKSHRFLSLKTLCESTSKTASMTTGSIMAPLYSSFTPPLQ